MPSSAIADKRNVDIFTIVYASKRKKNILWDVTADYYKLSELKSLAWKEKADILECETSLFSFRVVLAYRLRRTRKRKRQRVVASEKRGERKRARFSCERATYQRVEASEIDSVYGK